jgi:heptosyltransferase-2
VLTLCRTLVTNDSGAMHLAAAAGVGVTAVFGPTDETATRPLGEPHAILTNPVWCRPCMLRECPLDHQCMRGVGVDAVLASARRTL